MNIRNYKKEDFKLINSWWKSIGQLGPSEKQLPEESSFILENDNNTIAVVSVYLTNTDIAYVENLIIDPSLKDRKIFTNAIMKHAFDFARDKGYKYSAGFTTHEKLVKRNLEMGFDKAVGNLYLLAKEL